MLSSEDEDEYIAPARKKPRLQCWIPVGFNFQDCQIPDKALFPAIAAEADTLNASPDNANVAVASASAGAGEHPVMAATHLNARATGPPYREWIPEEDAKLTSAVKTTGKKKYGEDEYKTDWVAIAVQVPGRTRQQCKDRWYYILHFHSKSDETTARVGKWTAAEDSTLKDAIEKHSGKNWEAISALVLGQTKIQCMTRWTNALQSKSDETTKHMGKWTTYEDSTLKDAVEKHNGKNWEAISALIPGRTKIPCKNSWHNALQSKSDETTKRMGKCTTDEDSTLKDAVQKHNGKNWEVIAALVPGRSKRQCQNRWHDALHSTSHETTTRVGKWTKEEDVKLKNAGKKHNYEDWAAISELVLGRTKKQCRDRWNDTLHPKSDNTIKRKGKWTKEEDDKLADAVEKHNGENWPAISMLVPGRTKKQCRVRWVKWVAPTVSRKMGQMGGPKSHHNHEGRTHGTLPPMRRLPWDRIP
jgi:hypothetical protein